MPFDYCASCSHKFTEEGDFPYADGGVMEVNHGGGVCRSCYLSDGIHQECTSCKGLMLISWKFCVHCGVKNIKKE